MVLWCFVMFWLDRQNGKSAEKQYSNTRLFMPVLHCAARDVEPNLLLVAPVGLQTFLGRMATTVCGCTDCQVSREQRMWCQRPMSCDLWCQCSKMFHAWLYCNALGQGYMSTTPPLSCPVLKSRGFQGSTEFDDVCFSCFPKDILNLYIYIYVYIYIYMYIYIHTSSTAQGGGRSFKNRKPIGEVGCCDSGMAERSHWWTEGDWSLSLFLSLSLFFSLFLYLSLIIYRPTYWSICLPIYLSVCLSISLSIYLSTYLSIYLSLFLSFFHLSICLAVYLPICLSIHLSICLSVYLSICGAVSFSAM